MKSLPFLLVPAAAAVPLTGCVDPYYAAPPPLPPPPVVVRPAPVYVTPRPVYVEPRPVYVRPRPYARPGPYPYYHHPRRGW